MPAISPEAAVKEMYGMFRAAWVAQTPALNGGTPFQDIYDNKEAGPVDPSTKAWCRVSARHTGGGQATLGGIGGRRFERVGILFVQVFVPVGSGRTLLDKLGKIAIDTFEGKHSPSESIWFRECSIQEGGVDDGKWSGCTVRIGFVYDDVK